MKVLTPILILLFFIPIFVFAQEPMRLLSGFPGLGGGTLAQGSNIVFFLNILFNVLLIGAAMLAVIFIMIGGFEIMTRDSPFHISEGKNRIWNALVGLFIILGSYLILFTINPDLVRLDIFKNLQPITNTPGPVTGTGTGTGSGTGSATTPLPDCGNGICGAGETPWNCSRDCGPPPPVLPPG